MNIALISIAIAITSFVAGSPVQQCIGGSRAPALDHVVIAVRDLEAASEPFRTHGFRLKQGRLHPNNLLNRHIKFRDGTSIELMTVRGTPGDAMARDYADLISAGDGAVYVALHVPTVDSVDQAASAVGLAARHSTSAPWRFVSFARNSAAGAVFFSSGNATVQDPDSLLSHAPEVLGISEVWLEAGPELITLLERLGASRCGQARSPRGLTGDRYGLRRGSVVITSARTLLQPRLLGVTLQLRHASAVVTIWPLATFWVQYRSTGDEAPVHRF